jgi:hypothetical protein
VAGRISGAQGDGGAGALGGMSDASAFDADRRPAEVASWTDAGARRIQQAAAQGRRDGRLGQVAVTFDAAELEAEIGQVLRAEVRDADRAGASLRKQPLRRLPGRGRPLPFVRHRLMQEVEVERVETELPHAPLEAMQGLAIAVVADPRVGR